MSINHLMFAKGIQVKDPTRTINIQPFGPLSIANEIARSKLNYLKNNGHIVGEQYDALWKMTHATDADLTLVEEVIEVVNNKVL